MVKTRTAFTIGAARPRRLRRAGNTKVVVRSATAPKYEHPFAERTATIKKPILMTPLSTRVHARDLCACLLAVVVLIGTFGCAESAPEVLNVAGNVTYRGRPIPAGFVVFNPDRKQGNSGPQGFALINDGRFDTSQDGQGAVPGFVNMIVNGYDGRKATETSPHGSPLFVPYEKQVEISPSTSTFNVDVP